MNVTNIFDMDVTDILTDSSKKKEIQRYLSEVSAYCLNNQEEVYLSKYQYADDDFVSWLFSDVDEYHRFVLEFLSKKKKVPDEVENQLFFYLKLPINEKNPLSDYLSQRIGYLKKCQTISEYGEFMHSCFTKTLFSVDIVSRMKRMKDVDFLKNIGLFTKCLSILNDEAADVYSKNIPKDAFPIIQADTGCVCSPEDPRKDKDVTFAFKDPDRKKEDGSPILMDVVCSPHLKLVHPGTDLRIYFNWKVSKKNLVAVGHIDGHPYGVERISASD